MQKYRNVKIVADDSYFKDEDIKKVKAMLKKLVRRNNGDN